MKKVEIIERTSKAMKRTPSEQSSDESAYDEIGELQRRLPEGGDKTCEDFRHLNVECCERHRMHKALEQKLVARWPKWFNTGGDVRYTAMPRGFEHDDGWFDLLWRLCEELEPLVAEFEAAGGHNFEVLQVKEKFGGLRFYVNCRKEEAIRQRILAAELESLRTCEVCGKPGELREVGWIKTLCDEHASTQEAET